MRREAVLSHRVPGKISEMELLSSVISTRNQLHSSRKASGVESHPDWQEGKCYQFRTPSLNASFASTPKYSCPHLFKTQRVYSFLALPNGSYGRSHLLFSGTAFHPSGKQPGNSFWLLAGNSTLNCNNSAAIARRSENKV